jgi:hypothetical protein
MKNVREGSRRIKVIGQLTTILTAVLAVTVVVIQLVMPIFVYLLAALLTFKAPAVVGLTLWAAGWIIEGFTTGK